jgi:hypothetical protein
METSNLFKQYTKSIIKERTYSWYPVDLSITENLMREVDSRINKLLKKKTWSAIEAGKIYFYDYLKTIRLNDKTNNEHEKQQKLIVEKTIKSFNSSKFNNKVYKLYSELFKWLILAYHRGHFYIQRLESDYVRLASIIITAYEAEIILQETQQNIPDKAKEHLRNLTIDKFMESKESLIITSVISIRESLEKLMFYEVTLDIVGKLADIDEIIAFKISQANTKLEYIDALCKKTNNLKELLNKRSSKDKTKEKSIKIISEVINDIHPEKLIPKKERLIDETYKDRVYQQGFNLAIAINKEKNKRCQNPGF